MKKRKRASNYIFGRYIEWDDPDGYGVSEDIDYQSIIDNLTK